MEQLFLDVKKSETDKTIKSESLIKEIKLEECRRYVRDEYEGKYLAGFKEAVAVSSSMFIVDNKPDCAPTVKAFLEGRGWEVGNPVNERKQVEFHMYDGKLKAGFATQLYHPDD